MKSEEELYKVYQALGNPQRRKIIYLLGSRGPLSFSELKKSLNISVGALYYNIDQLGDLILQAPDKRYALTSKGMAVFNLMKSEEDLLEAVKTGSTIPSWAWSIYNGVRQLFFPREILSILYAKPKLGLITALAVMVIGVLVCSLTGTDVFLTYIRTGFKGSFAIPELNLYVRTDPRLFSAVTFIATWFIFSIIPYTVVSALKWEWDWNKLSRFLEGSAVSMLPAAIYVVIHSAVMSTGITGYATFASLGALFGILWALMIGSIAASLSIVKRISGSKALIIMVIVAYLCMTAQQALIVKWFATP